MQFFGFIRRYRLMKIISHNKPYSWLQWPVTIEGFKDLRLHVTAKFFGTAKINPIMVNNLLSSFYPIKPKYLFIHWSAEIFYGKDGTPAYVLELVEAPSIMAITHRAFDLIADDYAPYRPHITIPEDLWGEIAHDQLDVSAQDITFGELELHLGTPNG